MILPNGKLIQYNNNIYQSNLLRMLNIDDYNNIINNSVKIETVSYVGTGAYGESNPVSITFEFSPKVVFITGNNAASGNNGYIIVGSYGNNFISGGWVKFINGSITGKLAYKLEGTILRYYSDYNDEGQLNLRSHTYTATGLG